MARHNGSTKSVRVVVFRHGPAEDRDPVRWPNDERRPLTSKGRSQTRRAAKGLARVTDPVSRVASSAADRAVSSAQMVRAALDDPPKLETWPELAPGNLPSPIFDRLKRCVRSGEEVLLVGHEPTLAEFVGLALTGDGAPVVRLTKGGAACLEFPVGVRPGGGRLVWLLTRKQLADGAS
ncbi:MAG TPA: histidine phosphatase family protein [Thermoplasmata archaeon]|nr:histidine phosphatase family protein [Thermoplasmata archaeon]